MLRYSLLYALGALFFAGSNLSAQDVASQDVSSGSPLQAPNEILLEAGGRGGMYGISYERQLTPLFSVNVGATPYFDGKWSTGLSLMTVALPFAFNTHFSKSPNRIFADIGGTYAPTGSESTFIPSLGVGYRYRPDKSSITFKAQGLLTLIDGIGVFPWGGVAVGYSF